MKPNRRQFGFSLIEMLIVVAIIGILSALAMPSANGDAREQLHAAAHILSSDLDYARGLAVANNSSYQLAIDVAEQRYVLTHTGANAALDVLPETSYRSADDATDEQVVELDQLVTGAGSRASLLAAGTEGVLTDGTTIIEFGSLGEVTSAQDIYVWFTAGQGEGTLYIPVRVDAVTGLAWIDDVRSARPVGAPPE